jgi:50S ribosomal protein L16 3-hydroxylase
MRPGTRQPLGGLSAGAFLANHWHKEALLVRDAIPGYRGIITPDELFALAARDDVASRLVQNVRGRYTLDEGPFRVATLKRLPVRNWTLLVQGVNLHHPAADALLRRFAFIPYARLDDLMVSYATPGGGVGPHVDSYDVFLLQAEGRRRWRYGRQRDLRLRPDAPLRILRRFTPRHDCTLAPGDMLYLPPDVAHDGIALDACVTCSVGFRAPLHQELAEAFLDHLRDTVHVAGRYADPDLRLTHAPARIEARMQRRVAQTLAQVRWNADAVRRFLGRYLSEPKPGIVFSPGRRRSRTDFRRSLAREGVRLDRRTQLLYDNGHYYINGEDAALPPHDAAALRRLADRRALAPHECALLSREMTELLHAWHRHGYVVDAD